MGQSYVKINPMPELRIVFMGSPDFALPSLRQLAAHYCVVGVVTQPDRPAGRGNRLVSPPVKSLAAELGINTIQPNRMKDPGVEEQLRDWAPELIVVAAFGQILRQWVLDLPKYGCINVHASLLPRWRGAAPIHAAILHGDKQTGVTIMKMDTGIDTGAILVQIPEIIRDDDTTAILSNRLAELGARLLIETLPKYLAGTIVPQPQDDTKSCYAPMLKKEDGLLDFSKTADELERQVRACQPWPGAFFIWKQEIFKVHKAFVSNKQLPEGKHGREGSLPAIGTASGSLAICEIQPAGKRLMAGEVFLNGARDWMEVI